MPLLTVDKSYSVDMTKTLYVTESFLRHAEHGNKLLFTAVTTGEDHLDNEEMLQFMCLGCGGTINYSIARHFIQAGLVRVMNGAFFNSNESITVEVNWKLVGTNCAIAHLREYNDSNNELLGRILEAHVNPNRLFKRGLTKIFSDYNTTGKSGRVA